MKDKLKSIIYNLNYKFLMKNAIIMESNPDLDDNTGALFNEMLNQNLNKYFKIIWFVQNDNFKNKKIHNVKFININKSKFLKKYYNYFCKYIIDCNNFIYKKNKYQFRIHLTHGEWMKLPEEYCSKIGDVDYVTQCSNFFDELTMKYLLVNKDQVIATGFPRNDALLTISNETTLYRNSISESKIIVWVPTYRNHRNNKEDKTGKYYMNIKFKYGLPCIENEDQLYQLNDKLKNSNILLILKPHPVEDVSQLKKLNLSNIKIMYNDDLYKNNINIYNLLSVSDAMITDYSTIYHDYLITKKPIGLAIPDIKEYTKNIKLFTDNYEKDVPGEYIYNFDDLIKFVDNVSRGIDVAYNRRIEKTKIYHKYVDSESSKRVLDFFLKKIGFDKNEK